MPVITVTISDQANLYVRQKAKRKADLGRVVSDAIIAQKIREELSEHYSLLATKEQWDQDGVCVD